MHPIHRSYLPTEISVDARSALWSRVRSTGDEAKKRLRPAMAEEQLRVTKMIPNLNKIKRWTLNLRRSKNQRSAEESPTFICGCGHSGTTLIANMFGSHPQVFIPFRETGCFTQGFTGAPVPEAWLELLNEFRASKKLYLFEKTPKHILALDKIRSVVKSPKFILMVRDGRDVAASHIKRFGDAMIGAERWAVENRIVLKEMHSPDAITVRYEDLITMPEEALTRICNFLQIPFDPQMLQFHKKQNFWFGVSKMEKGGGQQGAEHLLLRNWQINQPIFDGRGNWKKLLSAEELRFFDREDVSKLMSEFGYL